MGMAFHTLSLGTVLKDGWTHDDGIVSGGCYVPLVNCLKDSNNPRSCKKNLNTFMSNLFKTAQYVKTTAENTNAHKLK